MPVQTKQRKVAIMGYRAVGKSSLAVQFVQGNASQFCKKIHISRSKLNRKSIFKKIKEWHIDVQTRGYLK